MLKLKVEFNYSTIGSTIQLFNYLSEGKGRSWKVRVWGWGAYGDEAGKRKKEQTGMWNFSRHHPPPTLQDLQGEGGDGITHARLSFFHLSCFIPLSPLTLQDLEGERGGGITYACLFFLPLPCFIPLPPSPISPRAFTPTLTLQDLLLPSPE